MKAQITYDIFDKVDIRIGTVLSVKKNAKARKPSLINIGAPWHAVSSSKVKEKFISLSRFVFAKIGA